MVDSTSHPPINHASNLNRFVAYLTVVLAIASNSAFCQYTFSSSSGTFTPLSGGTVVSAIHTDDNISGTLPLGFDFNYFGKTFSNFKASSNGFISFDLANAGQENGNSIGGSASSFKIAPLWDDVGGQQGTASYLVSGVAPNRVFTFEWLNWLWRYTAANPSISFQVKLYESSNRIELIYRQEAGAVEGPSASIGLVGNVNSVYYSLNGTGASPTASTSVPTNNLTTRPATGQVYTFTPTAGSTPGTQASNVVVNSVGYSSLSFYWTAGNGQYRSVFMKKTAAVESPNPVNNVVYSSSSIFGSGVEIGSSGWFSVYNGTETSTTVTNLELGTTYRIAVLEYNGASPAYLTSAVTNNPVNGTTLDIPMPAAATSVITTPSFTTMALSWTNGGGGNRAVFMKQTSDGNATVPVTSNSSYSASSSFGSGSQVGSSGWYCVYNGTGTSVNVSNLALDTDYRIQVVEYNTAAGTYKYATAASAGNPINSKTLDVPAPTTPATSVTFAGTEYEYTTLSWVPGNGTNRVVFAKQTSLLEETASVAQGVNYSPSNSFGYGSQIGSTGWFCVYNGGGNTVTVSNLQVGTSYQFQVLEYNTSSSIPKYLAISSAGNPNNVTTKNVPTPTISANSISVGATPNTLSVSWVNGNGSDRVVFIRETTSTTETAPLSNNSTYYPNSRLGWGSEVAGWFCVFDTRYSGQVNSVAVTGIRSDTEYQVQVIEYNQTPDQSYQRYLLSAADGNPAHVITPLGAPSLPSSTIDPTFASGTQIGIYGTTNIGDFRAVFIKKATGGAVEEVPVENGVTYYADTYFGDGSEVGSSGWFCVLNQDQVNSHTIYGLEENTTYLMQVVDYNGSGSTSIYRPASERFRTSVFTTLRGTPSLGYTLASTTEEFTPLSTGTRVNSIEQNYAYSEEIPVGFSFYYDGVPFTSLWACSGGFLTFNKYLTNPNNAAYNDYNYLSYYNYDLAYSPLRPTIAPISYYGYGGSAESKVTYATTGSAPNRVFTIEYLNWRWNSWQPSSNLSFQVRLHEADGRIEYVYRRENSDYYTPQGPIGLSLMDYGVSYSLSNSGPNPSLLSYTNWVSPAPASGQVYSFSPVRLNQTITFNNLPDKVYGDVPFQLTATASSGLPVSFELVSGPAKITDNQLAITGAGTVTVRAKQQGNDFVFNAAPSVDRSFYVDKATQTITFNSLANLEYGQERTLTATNSSGLPVSFESDDTNVAEINGGTKVKGVDLGTVAIYAYNNGDENHYATDTYQLLSVVQAKQTIAFDAIGDKNAGDADFLLSATASSQLAVSFSISGPATLNGNKIDITGAGTVQITASQPGNSYYLAAPNVVRKFEVNAKQGQTISFGELTSKTVDDAPFALTATASSNLPVTFSSSDNSIAEVSGNTVTIKKSGTVVIKASQSGNASFNAALDVDRALKILKKGQSITFAELSPRKVSDGSFTLTATTTSSLPVSFTSSNPAVASVSGNTVTIIGVGSTTITASQSGNDTFNAAAEVARLLQVNEKLQQTITFQTIGNKKMGEGNFTLSATASSGLAVSYSSSNSNVATVLGSTVSIVGVGSAMITANQSGNGDYAAAPPVLQFLNVGKAAQTITFGALADKVYGEAPFSLSAMSSSGLSVTFGSSNSDIASITGNVVTLTGAGTVTITAFQGGNSTFEAATPVSRTLNVTLVTGDIPGLEVVTDLYPNPAVDFVTIESRLVSGNHTLQTTDGSGRRFDLPTKKISDNKLSVEVRDLSSGMYYLQLNNAGERTTYRLFKK